MSDEFAKAPVTTDKDAFAARIHGDSMSPKYNDGDIVIFSPEVTVRNGDDCFVKFIDGHTTFKRVFNEAAEGMRLQPRNAKYRAQIILAEKIEGVYGAIFKYSRVDE